MHSNSKTYLTIPTNFTTKSSPPSKTPTILFKSSLLPANPPLIQRIPAIKVTAALKAKAKENTRKRTKAQNTERGQNLKGKRTKGIQGQGKRRGEAEKTTKETKKRGVSRRKDLLQGTGKKREIQEAERRRKIGERRRKGGKSSVKRRKKRRRR